MSVYSVALCLSDLSKQAHNSLQGFDDVTVQQHPVPPKWRAVTVVMYIPLASSAADAGCRMRDVRNFCAETLWVVSAAEMSNTRPETYADRCIPAADYQLTRGPPENNDNDHRYRYIFGSQTFDNIPNKQVQ